MYDGHPFYVSNLGWVTADKFLANNKILMYNNEVATLINKKVEMLDHEETTYNFEVEDYHTYYVGDEGILVHNKCIFDEQGVENYNQVGAKYTPDELINKLDDLGFSKEVTHKRGHSGLLTIMKRGNLSFRIQSSPANGKAYFRVMNSGEIILVLRGLL